MVHALTKSVVKDGPVVGVDDDAEIHPDLLQLIWKVKKAGMWPIGNLVCDGNSARKPNLISVTRGRAGGKGQQRMPTARSLAGQQQTP